MSRMDYEQWLGAPIDTVAEGQDRLRIAHRRIIELEGQVSSLKVRCRWLSQLVAYHKGELSSQGGPPGHPPPLAATLAETEEVAPSS